MVGLSCCDSRWTFWKRTDQTKYRPPEEMRNGERKRLKAHPLRLGRFCVHWYYVSRATLWRLRGLGETRIDHSERYDAILRGNRKSGKWTVQPDASCLLFSDATANWSRRACFFFLLSFFFFFFNLEPNKLTWTIAKTYLMKQLIQLSFRADRQGYERINLKVGFDHKGGCKGLTVQCTAITVVIAIKGKSTPSWFPIGRN